MTMHINKYLAITLVALPFAFGAYARIWECSQEQETRSAVVRSIRPYSRTGNDLHWSPRGFRAYVYGEDRPIDFPSRKWDETVKENSAVTITTRRSFPLFGDELDGITITDDI